MRNGENEVRLQDLHSFAISSPDFLGSKHLYEILLTPGKEGKIKKRRKEFMGGGGGDDSLSFLPFFAFTFML